LLFQRKGAVTHFIVRNVQGEQFGALRQLFFVRNLNQLVQNAIPEAFPIALISNGPPLLIFRLGCNEANLYFSFRLPAMFGKVPR
jgi:hypothetical protein